MFPNFDILFERALEFFERKLISFRKEQATFTSLTTPNEKPYQQVIEENFALQKPVSYIQLLILPTAVETMQNGWKIKSITVFLFYF